MKIIAITGGIGSGKSTIAKKLCKALEFEYIDIDLLAHEVLTFDKVISELVNQFGDKILENGIINRRVLSQCAFVSVENTKKLNDITHKYIFKTLYNKISELNKNNQYGVVVEIPLLFSCSEKFNYDLSIVVIADKETRINRVIKRSGLTREQVIQRMSRQMSDEDMINQADIVIKNE